jgi:hypothetical protein
MKFSRLIIALASCIVIAGSCETDNLLDENIKYSDVDSASSAFVKIIQNFAGNTPQLPTAANLTTGPQVFVYANGQKLTGNALGYAGIFPATAIYAAVPAGQNMRIDVVQARMNLTVVPNVPAPIAGDTLVTVNQTLAAGKFYSVIIGDTVPKLTVDVREDVLAVPEYQTYKIRLANWDMNLNDTLTLYSRRQKAEIIQNVSHKQISDWVQLTLPIISDTLELRRKGSTATYLTVGGTAPTFSPAGMRMYTVFARGKTGVTAKTPSASIVTNR